MEKYDFEQELKEAVLVNKENHSTVLVLSGEEVEVNCPEWCRTNINEEGSPCLAAVNKNPKDGKYSIMAFSLDIRNRENKCWICIKPVIFEEAIEFFLANHYMEEMVGGCKADSGKSNKGKTEPDFVAEKNHIELNIPYAILNAADGGWMQVRSLFLDDEKITRYRNIISDLKYTAERIIFLTVFQHGLNEKMQDWLCKEISKYLGMDMEENTEFWIADLKFKPDGIILMSYQNITEKVLLE